MMFFNPNLGRPSLALMGMLVAFCGATASARADTASVQVNGQISAGTCSLTTEDENRTVTLPTVNTKDMPDNGKASESTTPFNLTVENCPPGLTGATFTFAGTPDPADGQVFQNTGAATGVAIVLESSTDKQVIRADGTGNTRTVPIAGATAVLGLAASYWRLPSAALKAGSVRAVATVEVTYE